MPKQILVTIAAAAKKAMTANNLIAFATLMVAIPATVFTYKGYIYQTQADQRAETAANRMAETDRRQQTDEESAHETRVKIVGRILDEKDPDECKLALEQASSELRLPPEQQKLWQRAWDAAREARKPIDWFI